MLLALGMGKPTAADASRTVRNRHATPWQRGMGMPVLGACFPRVLQRCAGCAGMRVLFRLYEVRQICPTCYQFLGRGYPNLCTLRGLIIGPGQSGLKTPFILHCQGKSAC